MRVLLAEDEKRMGGVSRGPYKVNGVPSLSAERGCAPVLYVIYHIFLG